MAVQSRPRCDRTPAWAALQAHFGAHGKSFDLRQAIKVGPDEKVCAVLSGGNWNLPDLAEIYKVGSE